MDRPDPVTVLEDQNLTREPDLVPVRHGRMMVSPFTFYRGAAKIMATDLAGTPTAGFTSQLCGDAHLSNFGVFASPERRLLFDVNDFDETLPGPFEYDVKRMADSFTIAARNNGLTKAEGAQVTAAAVRAYRESMAQFARMGVAGAFPGRRHGPKGRRGGQRRTRVFIVLLQGRDDQDPLFRQVKEATTSVLENHLPKSRYTIPANGWSVPGQRMMQASSDIYLRPCPQ